MSKTLSQVLKGSMVSAPAGTHQRRSVLEDSPSATRTSAVRKYPGGTLGTARTVARSMRIPTYGEYVRDGRRMTAAAREQEARGGASTSNASFGLSRSNAKLTINQ